MSLLKHSSDPVTPQCKSFHGDSDSLQSAAAWNMVFPGLALVCSASLVLDFCGHPLGPDAGRAGVSVLRAVSLPRPGTSFICLPLPPSAGLLLCIPQDRLATPPPGSLFLYPPQQPARHAHHCVFSTQSVWFRDCVGHLCAGHTAEAQQLPLRPDNHKCLQMLPDVSWEAKSTPLEKPCL